MLKAYRSVFIPSVNETICNLKTLMILSYVCVFIMWHMGGLIASYLNNSFLLKYALFMDTKKITLEAKAKEQVINLAATAL